MKRIWAFSLLIVYSLFPMEQNDNTYLISSAPAPFLYYIQRMFNITDQNDYCVSVSLLKNQKLPRECRESALQTLKDLDLKGFCPAQYYLYYFYLQGMKDMPLDTRQAWHYLMRAVNVAYPPALVTYAEHLMQGASEGTYSPDVLTYAAQLIYGAAQVRFVPLYDNDGKFMHYQPCQYERAGVLHQYLMHCYQQLHQASMSQDTALNDKYEELDQQHPDQLQILQDAFQQLYLHEDNNASSSIDSVSSTATSLPIVTDTKKKEVSINKWSLLRDEFAQNDRLSPDEKALKILTLYHSTFDKEDRKDVLQQMIEENIISLLEEENTVWTSVACVYGSLLYDIAKYADTTIMQLLVDSNISADGSTTDDVFAMAYENLLRAQQAHNPCASLILAELVHEEKKIAEFLASAFTDAYKDAIHLFPHQTPSMIRGTVIQQLQQYVNEDTIESIIQVVLCYIQDANTTFDMNVIIPFVKQLSAYAEHIDMTLTPSNDLVKQLVSVAESHESLVVKYEVGTLLHRLITHRKALSYHDQAQKLLLASIGHTSDALKQVLAMYHDNNKRALELFLNVATSQDQKSDEICSVLKDFFDLCKEQARTQADLAYFVGEQLEHGIAGIVEHDDEQACHYYHIACEQSSYDIMMNLLQKTLLVASASNEDLRLTSLLSCCLQAITSYTKSLALQQPNQIPEELKEKLIEFVQSPAALSSCRSVYKLIEILIPFDPLYAGTLLYDLITYDSLNKDVTLISSLVQTLEKFADTHPSLLKYILFFDLDNHHDPDIQRIISTVSKVSPQLLLRDNDKISCRDLINNLILLAEHTKSLALKYVTATLLYDFITQQECVHYYAKTKALSLASKYYSDQALKLAFTIHYASPNKDDKYMALGLIPEAASLQCSPDSCLPPECRSMLKTLFEYCKQEALEDPVIALLVARGFESGIVGVAEPDCVQADYYYKKATQGGSQEVMMLLWQKVLVLQALYGDNAIPTSFFNYCLRALTSFISFSQAQPLAAKKDLLKKGKDIVITMLTKAMQDGHLKFVYKCFELLMPYDPDYVNIMFYTVEHYIEGKNNKDYLSMLCQETALLDQLESYACHEARCVLLFAEVLFARLVKNCWPESEKSKIIKKVKKLLTVAHTLDPNIPNYKKLQASIALQESIYLIDQNKIQQAIACLRAVKNDNVIARALYGDILLKGKDENLSSIESYKLGIQELEAALASCSAEKFGHIIPTVFNLASFYLEPPIFDDGEITFLNVERGVELLHKLAQTGEQRFIDQLHIWQKRLDYVAALPFLQGKKLFFQKEYARALALLVDLKDEQALAYSGLCFIELKEYDKGVKCLMEFFNEAFSHEQDDDDFIHLVATYLMNSVCHMKTFTPKDYNTILCYLTKAAHHVADQEKLNYLESIVTLFGKGIDKLLAIFYRRMIGDEIDDIMVLLEGNLADNLQQLARECKAGQQLMEISHFVYKVFVYLHLGLMGKDSNHALKAVEYKILHQAIACAEDALACDHKNIEKKHHEFIADLYLMNGQMWEYQGDIKKALENFTKAIRYNNKNDQAWFKRGIVLLNNSNDARDTNKAIADLTKAAQEKSIKAQTYLGTILLNGSKVKKTGQEIAPNVEQALKWLEQAANAEEPDRDAIAKLGNFYLHGNNSKRPRYKDAYRILKKARELKLGDGYDFGIAALRCSTYLKKARSDTTQGKKFMSLMYEAMDAFKKSTNPYSLVMLAQIHLTQKDEEAVQLGFNYLEKFLNSITMNDKVIEDLTDTEIYELLSEDLGASTEAFKWYIYALDAYKRALHYATTGNMDKLVAHLAMVKKYLLESCVKVKNDEKIISLINGLYAAYYLLSVQHPPEGEKTQFLIARGISYWLAATSGNLKLKYDGLKARKKEIKNIVAQFNEDDRKYFNQSYTSRAGSKGKESQDDASGEGSSSQTT